MELNTDKDQIQNTAVEAWINKTNKKGTVQMITGIGKTFMALKALYTMPKFTDTLHLFLAETVERQSDLIKDIVKFNAINNCNVMQDYNLQFQCYQTVYKWQNHKFGLVICDEIHDQLSPEYFKFHLYNNCDAVLGLSALINSDRSYVIKKEHDLRSHFNKDIINKHDMLNHIAPICFKYSVNEGQKENTSRKLNIYVIKHTLDSVTKSIKAGNSKSRFYQTELAAYSYANKLFNTAVNIQPQQNEDFYVYEQRKNIEIMKASNKRSKVLYELPSKIDVAKTLLEKLNSKTIIFGNSLEQLSKITPNVVSSNNTDEKNEEIRNNFDNNIINTIASFKKLKQGANLDGVDNCIFISYYSSEVDFIQRVGRLRQNKGKVGNVFILVTENTQEEKWFNKMMENMTEYTIIPCENIDDCLTKYKTYDS